MRRGLILVSLLMSVLVAGCSKGTLEIPRQSNLRNGASPGPGVQVSPSPSPTPIPTPTGLVNIAPLATITTHPYASYLSRAVDGAIGSGVSMDSDYVFDRTYEFRFAGAQPVSQIRFTLPPVTYSLWADTTGNGRYDTELVSVLNGRESLLWDVQEWAYGEWKGASPVRAFGIRLHEPSIKLFTKSGSHGTPPQVGEKVYQWSTDGVRQHRSGTVILADSASLWVQESNGEGWTWGSSGWLAKSDTDPANRWVYSAEPEDGNSPRSLYDFQILAINASLTQAAREALKEANHLTLENGVPVTSTGDKVTVSPPAVQNQYTKGVYIENWMMDLPGWIGSSPRGRLQDWPQYRAMVSRIREVGANLVWIMPTRSGFENGVRTDDVYRSEVLWPSDVIAKSSPENYLAMIATALHADGIRIFAGDRPYPGWSPKNSSVSPESVFAGGVAEMAGSGIDGVAVCFDESNDEDAAHYAAAVAAAKSANPNIITFANLIYSGYDEIGHNANMDLLGGESYFTFDDPSGHWTGAMATSRLIGANPNRETILTQNAPWAPDDGNNPLFYETFPPVSMYGMSLSIAFHGAHHMSYWRLQEFLYRGGYQKHAATGYSMLDTLAAWGGKSAVVPSDILVLGSGDQAANQHWAYLTYTYGSAGNPIAMQPYAEESRRGSINNKAILEILLKAGLPFQFRFEDYPADLPDLSKVRIVIVPFAYRMPAGTRLALENAADAGTKVIILGPAQTLATDRPGGANGDFTTLLGKANVILLTDDVLYGVTWTIREHVLGAVLNALGTSRPTYFNSYGHDVEVAVLHGTGENARKKYLLVTNWEPDEATVDVGVIVPAGGQYEMLQRNLQEVTRVAIGGSTTLTATQVGKFRLTLAAGESRIFLIEQKTGVFTNWLKSFNKRNY